MKLLIKGGRVIDPASGRDEVGDVFIAAGKISGEKAKADRTIDAKGLIVAPGLIDLAARLREPGHGYKATLESEMDAAVAGGVTSLACPPDTAPPLDEPSGWNSTVNLPPSFSCASHLRSGAGQMLTGRKFSRFSSISRAGPPSG